MEKKTINFFVGPKRGVPQLSPLAQLQLPLSIGDDGIPQYGSKFLSSAHLSAQLQLTHQLSYWNNNYTCQIYMSFFLKVGI